MKVTVDRQRHMWFKDAHETPLPDREIVVDCFAGGGGASVGLERGIGRHVDEDCAGWTLR